MVTPESNRSPQTVSTRVGTEVRRLRDAAQLTQRALAERAHYSRSYIALIESGREKPSAEAIKRIAHVLQDHGTLQSLHSTVDHDGPHVPPADDELDALELSRRIDASDLSAATLQRLRAAVDDLATEYALVSPSELLTRMRRHLTYVAQLIDVRKTLDQHRQLLVTGAWLSLLGATLHIDLRERRAANARLLTAEQMARQAGHTEILAWCLETRAWDELTSGDFRSAITLSQQAQALAPTGSSVQIQATAQEGRAWARMRHSAEAHGALRRVHQLVSPLLRPDQPENHYQYDPAKALSYTATTLAWMRDPAAEAYARQAILQMETKADGTVRPRRAASARLDLALALLAANKPDEASTTAVHAIASGRIVPSNRWRAKEIVVAVEASGIREASELREAYEAHQTS